MRKRLLHILGAGPWQLPTVRLAKSLGHRVLVSDLYPDRPAYALADFHEVVDITDLESTLAVAARYRIDGILCDTTDIGVATAAYVAEQLGLPGMGYETALNFTDKGRMRQLTDRGGLVVPRYRLVTRADELENAAAEVAYPLIVKPVDNQSGRGVSRLGDGNNLAAAYQAARGFSRSGQVLIESCVEGSEIIVDGFVVNGHPQILGVARKIPYPDTVTVSSRIHYPGGPPGSDFDRIQSATCHTVTALGLLNGVFHAEFMIHGHDVVPIDIAARGGGVMIYSHIVPYISGVNANREMVQWAIGESIAIKPRRTPRAANIEFIRMPPGRLSEIIGIEAAAAVPGVAAIHFNLGVGEQVGALEHKDRRPGYVVALADTAREVIDISLQAKSLLSVRMDEGQDPVAIA